MRLPILVTFTALIVAQAGCAQQPGNVGDHSALTAPSSVLNHIGEEPVCTPGFWKNHTELWFGAFDEATATQLLADLEGKGPGSEAIRNAAALTIEGTVGQLCLNLK